MRNLFTNAVLLAATSSAFDYETNAALTMQYKNRRQQRMAPPLNKEGNYRNKTQYERPDPRKIIRRPLKEPEQASLR